MYRMIGRNEDHTVFERLRSTFVISLPTAGITLDKSLVGKHSCCRPLDPDVLSYGSTATDTC